MPEPRPPANSILQEPWALVKRGGRTDTGVSFTRIAYLVMLAGGGGLANPGDYYAYIGNESLRGWTTRQRIVPAETIVARWQQPPSKQQIRETKKRLRESEAARA